MRQCRVALLGKGPPFPAERALPWRISGALRVTLFSAWTTILLGFGNEWYQPALEAATAVQLPSRRRIRMVAPAYFLATKLAAFDGRGNGDYLMSHDMEDVVAVLDGRPEIVNEVKVVATDLRNHLARRFSALLADPRFVSALSGHLPTDAANQRRLPLLIQRIESIAKER